MGPDENKNGPTKTPSRPNSPGIALWSPNKRYFRCFPDRNPGVLVDLAPIKRPRRGPGTSKRGQTNPQDTIPIEKTGLHMKSKYPFKMGVEISWKHHAHEVYRAPGHVLTTPNRRPRTLGRSLSWLVTCYTCPRSTIFGRATCQTRRRHPKTQAAKGVLPLPDLA